MIEIPKALLNQPVEMYEGYRLVGFPAGKELDDFLKRIDHLQKGREKVNRPECLLDHSMRFSSSYLTPQPMIAYSVQNRFETIEEANVKRNDDFSPSNFTVIYEWNKFNPSPEGIAALDEEIERISPNWKRKRLDPNVNWFGASKEKWGENAYGSVTGLDSLGFYLQIKPYDLETGLTEHPTVREITIHKGLPGLSKPVAAVTDRSVLDKIPFKRRFEYCGHILEPTKEGITIYHADLNDSLK